MSKTFADLESQSIQWQKARWWRSDYELRDDDGDVIARLKPVRRGAAFEVEAAGNRWLFRRRGFWKRRVEIRSVATDEEPAVFTFSGQRGRLEYADGRIYLWQRGGWWGAKWSWAAADGTPLVGFELRGTRCKVYLDPDQAGAKAPSLLIFLGWYLIVLHIRDQAAGAAAIAAAGG